jgi:hypothetical protein
MSYYRNQTIPIDLRPENMSKDEEMEWRSNKRRQLPISVSVWARSPSPPLKLKKVNQSLTNNSLGINKNSTHHIVSKHTSKSRKVETSSSSSSSSSSSDSSSTDTSSSDSSSDSDIKHRRKKSHKKKKSHHKKETKYPNEDLDLKQKSNHINNLQSSSVPSATPAMPAIIMEDSNYDKEEAERFRQDVQGNKYDDDEENEDFGPTPLPQPKDYADDKKVNSFIYIYIYIRIT